MPLPLGHAAIGLATYQLSSKEDIHLREWKTAIFVSCLANLPDLDVVIGLLFRGNGDAFHRGPTHSLLFALTMGFWVGWIWKRFVQLPKIPFGMCFAMVLSHVLADLFLTSSPVSLFWPFELHWSQGWSGWQEVLSSVFFQAFQDVWIIAGCSLLILLTRFARGLHRGSLPGFYKSNPMRIKS